MIGGKATEMEASPLPGTRVELTHGESRDIKCDQWPDEPQIYA